MTRSSDIPANDALLTEAIHATTPQDCQYFLPEDPHQPVVQYDPEQVMDSFLAYHFAPWDNPFQFFSLETLRKLQQEKIQQYTQTPGWGLNKHPLSQEFIARLIDNMQLASFPCYQQPAMTVRAADLRTLPCNKPSFTDWVSAGEGYPFDNWQEALLAPNTPLRVLHTSQDGAWHFVMTAYTCGWVQKEALAYVTPAFMAQWKTKQYITPLCDDVPVIGNMLAPLARVGQLLPLAPTQNTPASYEVLTVAKDLAGYAVVQVGSVPKTETARMPLLATPSNMAQLANRLMGQPYGWCGLAGYRDCASILKVLLMPFGIWMPVTTGPQSKSGAYVSLDGMKDTAKEKLLQTQGIPFFSLVWWPGHIVLYLGAKKDRAYVYQDLWGLRTATNGKEGRAVVGKVVITSLDLGQAYSNIKVPLLSKAKGLILLNNRLTNPHEKLALHPK